jgi:rhamnosyltransferase
MNADFAAATVLYRPDPTLLDGLLLAIEAEALRLWVFVNGPLDPVVEDRLARSPNLRILRSPTNVGLGHGLNAVAEAAATEGCSHLLLFDQDSTPGPGLAAALAAAFEGEAAGGAPVAAAGPRLVSPEGETHLAPWYSRRSGGSSGAKRPVDFLPTSGTLISLAAWRRIGPFRADYFVDGIDVEWCFRAWSAGYRCLLVENVTMAHRWGHGDDGGRAQILRQSPERVFYYLRNAVHGLRLPTLPWRWRARTALRLAGQIGLLLLDRRFDGPTRRLVVSAVGDGWRGRLGPAA